MPRNLGISLWAMRSHWKQRMHAGRGVLLEVFCRKGARGMYCAGAGRERSRERLEGGNTWTLEWEMRFLSLSLDRFEVWWKVGMRFQDKPLSTSYTLTDERECRERP